MLSRPFLGGPIVYRRLYRQFATAAGTGCCPNIKSSGLDNQTVSSSTLDQDTRSSPVAKDIPSTLDNNYTPAPSTDDHTPSSRPKLIHHVFRWGVGNAFRAQAKNRYRPTHAERNTAVSLREDYFHCDAKFERCKVTYDKLNEQWEVLWTEFGKINGKPFPVKKFGIEASKAESLKFAQELDNRLGNSTDSIEEPEEQGITFDHTLHCWVALGRVGRRTVARAYSADFHGYEIARKRAIDFRNTSHKNI
ncbi:transcription factor with AP2 domain(s) [Babesia ovis]|uniref:Transcription factor with AP2 domain(S) n=1 Tax=Babesia ovis TaxID=5869 RepID=A0A9W5WUD2_BABOV|nr:transcription factor with AP2 domain(s) [Babesia ovis]